MSQHITPKKTYFGVFVSLLILTGLTTWIAFFDLGPFNNVVALGIAIAKALLVILFFMHIRYSSRLTWAFLSAGILFLIILFSLTMSDTETRKLEQQPTGWSSQTAMLKN